MCSSTVSLRERGADQLGAQQDGWTLAVFFSSTTFLPLKKTLNFFKKVTRRKNSRYTNSEAHNGTFISCKWDPAGLITRHQAITTLNSRFPIQLLVTMLAQHSLVWMNPNGSQVLSLMEGRPWEAQKPKPLNLDKRTLRPTRWKRLCL